MNEQFVPLNDFKLVSAKKSQNFAKGKVVTLRQGKKTRLTLPFGTVKVKDQTAQNVHSHPSSTLSDVGIVL